MLDTVLDMGTNTAKEWPMAGFLDGGMIKAGGDLGGSWLADAAEQLTRGARTCPMLCGSGGIRQKCQGCGSHGSICAHVGNVASGCRAPGSPPADTQAHPAGWEDPSARMSQASVSDPKWL